MVHVNKSFPGGRGEMPHAVGASAILALRLTTFFPPSEFTHLLLNCSSPLHYSKPFQLSLIISLQATLIIGSPKLSAVLVFTPGGYSNRHPTRVPASLRSDDHLSPVLYPLRPSVSSPLTKTTSSSPADDDLFLLSSSSGKWADRAGLCPDRLVLNATNIGNTHGWRAKSFTPSL